MNGEFTRQEFSKELDQDLLYNSEGLPTKPVDVEIEGRTLVNLLGRAGNAIYKQRLWDKYNLLKSVDFDCEWYKFVNNESEELDRHASIMANLEAGKHYILIADTDSIANIYSAFSIALFRDEASEKQIVSPKNAFAAVAIKMNKDAKTGEKRIILRHRDNIPNSDKFRVKYIRLYEITEEEFVKIGSTAEYVNEKLLEKYPYVDDVKPVVNPYIECKENLIDGARWYVGATSGDGMIEYPAEEYPYYVSGMF